MSTPADSLDAAINDIWGSDYVQKNPNKAYKTSYASEYQLVAAYLNGGPRPNPASFSKMGRGLVVAEDVRRELVSEPEPPSEWTKVADEGGQFTLTETKEVRFGSGSTWTSKVLAAGTHACTKAVFGSDPAPGVYKRCEARPASNVARSAPTGKVVQ